MIGWQWTARAAPLSPRAVAATGDAVRALARRLLDRDDAALARLRGVAGPDAVLVVIGDDLPWVDGVTYLGWDPEAPTLLVPTALAPTVPAGLVEAAFARRFPGESSPLAVLPEIGRVVPTGDARPLERNALLPLL
jgi:hypothetical protein